MKKNCFLWTLMLGSLLSFPTDAHDRGDFLVRVRALYIDPNDVSGFCSIPGGGVSVRENWTGEVDFSYMFSRHLGTELILGASKHKLTGRGTIEGLPIGSTWLLPPTLTLQYHFLPECRFQPYVGAGGNFTLFFDKTTHLANTRLSLKNSWGWALQAGLDFYLTGCWFLNVDVKYIDIRTTATLSGDTSAQIEVEINPWVVGLGVGRRF